MGTNVNIFKIRFSFGINFNIKISGKISPIQTANRRKYDKSAAYHQAKNVDPYHGGHLIVCLPDSLKKMSVVPLPGYSAALPMPAFFTLRY